MEIKRSDLKSFLKLYERVCKEIAREFDKSQKSMGQCFNELNDSTAAILNSLERIPAELKPYLNKKLYGIEKKLARRYRFMRYFLLERKARKFIEGILKTKKAEKKLTGKKLVTLDDEIKQELIQESVKVLESFLDRKPTTRMLPITLAKACVYIACKNFHESGRIPNYLTQPELSDFLVKQTIDTIGKAHRRVKSTLETQ